MSVRTLGCKVNACESEQILQGLIARGGWRAAREGREAGLFIVNSCTVTREAARQTRQEIRRCIRQNPDALVVVTGCHAQMQPESCAAIEGVDLVVGNRRKLEIPELIPRLERGDLPRVLVPEDLDDEFLAVPDPALNGFHGRSRAFVQVQQGCNQGCTFCIIHRARGESRSAPPERVLAQVERLVDSGFREVVLCGVDLGAYGRDRDARGAATLCDLAREVLGLGGDFHVRLGSLDPSHLSDELLDLIATESRLCPHLHVSMQSGHTLILKRMKRRYDRELLFERVFAARSRIEDLILGADLIAGFPTEEDAHFHTTLTAVDELGIAFPHVFPYSERPGTPAARIPRQVPKATRAHRAARLRAAGTVALRRELERRVGSIVRALVEQHGARGACARGRLDNYLPVDIHGPTADRGDRVPVRVTGHADGRLIGETFDERLEYRG